MKYLNIGLLVFWTFCLGYDTTKNSKLAIALDVAMVLLSISALSFPKKEVQK